MKEIKTTIHCEDTGKDYVMPDRNGPQLWAIQIKRAAVDKNSGFYSFDSLGAGDVIHVERQTLVNAGMLPACERDEPVKEETKETMEDLILRVLEMVGLYREQ